MSQEEQEEQVVKNETAPVAKEEEPLEAEAATATANANDDGDDDDVDEDPPTTVLILLGDGIHFEHSGEKNVMSLKILSKSDLESSLQTARKVIEKQHPETMLEAVHVIITASSIPIIFDAKVVSTFVFALKEDGDFTFHILRNGQDKPPVEPADVDEIRYALVGEDGLDLTEEALVGDGDWTVTAKRNEWDLEEDEAEA